MPGFRLAWVNWLATALVLAGFVAVWVRSAPRARTGLLADAMTKDLDALAAALDRQPPALGYYPSCLAILGDRPQALRQAVEIRARRYEQINAELPPLRVDLEAAGNRVKSLQAGSEKELEHIRVGLAQQLELAVVASFGFWTTVSMLAMWRLLDRSRTPEHGGRVDRAGAAG